MNKRYFFEIFFGAALGMLIYHFMLRIENLHDIAESNLLLEITIMAVFAFTGILLLRKLFKFFFPAANEHSKPSK